ncbi:MAG: histidine phosphatase family protein [Lachnospiraceae bacterium]|nr:histidine phosphatase family protein [Lachnospiraceae bacterium]
MRILFIRHGDPDYVHDSLTEVGKKEAEALSQKLIHEKMDYLYSSPLGRAKETAEYTLSKLGRTAKEYDFLREFWATLRLNEDPLLQELYPEIREDGKRIVWDMLPFGWKDDPNYYRRDTLKDTIIAKHGDLIECLEIAENGFDALLETHGYKRKGNLYLCEDGNNDTIAIFCHFGITCVILAHLWNMSPFVLWHTLAMAPTSITEVYTEERKKGEVCFRAAKIGDCSHLYAAGITPSFSARFCESFENDWERH